MKKQKLEAIKKALESKLGLEIDVVESESRAFLWITGPTGSVVCKVGLGWDDYFQKWHLGSFDDKVYQIVENAVKQQG